MNVDRDQHRQETGRAFALKAARWLALTRFQSSRDAPFFSPGLQQYEDLFDPNSSDERRLDACRRMLSAVERNAELERLTFEVRGKDRRERDPYRREWRTTKHGAVLETIAEILTTAIAHLEAPASRT